MNGSVEIDDHFAEDCLKLWGAQNKPGGPEGYKRHSAFVLRARGIPTEWHDDLAEKIGWIVNNWIDEADRIIVKRYYEPLKDYRPGQNGQEKQCNMVLVIASFNEQGIKIDRRQINPVLDRAIGKVRGGLEFAYHYNEAASILAA